MAETVGSVRGLSSAEVAERVASGRVKLNFHTFEVKTLRIER